MNQDPKNPRLERLGKLAPHTVWAGLVLVLAWHFFLHWCSTAPAFGEIDPDGYLLLAKRIARFETLNAPESDPFLYYGHMWVDSTRGGVMPKFAPGYPVLLAFAYGIGGDEAMYYVSPIMGAVTILATYLLCRQCAGEWPSLLAAATLSINHPSQWYATYLLAHASLMAILTLGMALIFVWMKKPTLTRAIAAGLVLGFACAFRHTAVLTALALPPAAWAVYRHTSKREAVRQALAACAAFAAGPALVALYNWRYFGGPLITGYSLTNEQGALSFENFSTNARWLIGAFTNDLAYFVFPLGVIGFVAIGPMTHRLIRLAWFVPVFVVYACYYWAMPFMAYFRFLLDTVPLLIVSAFLLVENLNVPRATRWASLTAVFVFALHGAWPKLNEAMTGKWNEPLRDLAEAHRRIDAAVEPDAVIFCPDQSHPALTSRRRYSVYNLDAFNVHWGRWWFNVERPRDPRTQPERYAMRRQLYRELDGDSLLLWQREIVERSLADGRQVIYFMPIHRYGIGSVLLDDQFNMRELRTMYYGGKVWGLYEVSTGVR